MIGKVPKAGRGFGGLVRYLLNGPRDQVKAQDRIAWTATRNLAVDDPELVPKLMRATAALSRRVASPVYHYVISWHHNEAPTDDFMREVADTTSADLGLAEYQLLYIAHADTKHRHVHIVANRVHPETGVAWKASHDYRTIEQSLRRQSEAHGLDYVPGRHNDPDRFRGRARKARDPDFQRQRTSPNTLLAKRWSREHLQHNKPALADKIANASNWQELDESLADAGFALLEKGQGIVIADATGTAKLSDLGKGVRLAELQKRFQKSFKEHVQSRSVPDAEEEATIRANRMALRSAQEEAEFSFMLFRLGLMSRSQLDRHLADRDRVAEVADRDRPLGEQVARDVAKALRETRKERRPAPPQPKPPVPSKRRRDRDR